MQDLVKETQSFGFSQEWKTACQEWCQQQNLAKTQKELWKNLRDQWLQTDISIEGVQQKAQIKNPWLTAKKIVIKDTVYLQILSGSDISQSALSQLQSKLKLDLENSAVSADKDKPWLEPKPSRCLLLRLTDGFKKITAIEHEPIPLLKVINPGMKVVICGPLVCRKGMLLLTSKNLKILGGQVEELFEKYGEQKILSQRVGREDFALPAVPPVPPAPPANQRPNISEQPFADDDDDLFKDIDMPLDTNEKQPLESGTVVSGSGQTSREEPRQKRSVLQNPKPFTYLKYVPKDIERNEYAIKGTIVSLASKLKVCRQNGMKWELLVIVSDGTDNRTFNVSPELLETWIGIQPEKYDKTKKDDFRRCLEKTSERLIKFNGIMKIRKEMEKIVIFQMNPLNPGHLRQLKIRQGLA